MSIKEKKVFAVLTIDICSSHSSSIETKLHGQTSSCGEDATHLCSQQGLGVLEGGSRQQCF